MRRLLPALLLLLLLPCAGLCDAVDLNSATVEELSALPGLSPELAGRIVAHRGKAGPFKTVFDLMKVEGVTGEIFQPLVGRLSATPPAPEASGAAAAGGKSAPRKAAESEPPAGLGSPISEGRRAGALRAPSAEAGAGRIGRTEATPEALFKAGFGLARRGKFDMAEKMFAQFIEGSPGHRYLEDARYLRAACFEEMEKYPAAIDAYRAVYETQGSVYRSIALFRLAVCEDLSEDHAAALSTYERFLAEFPDSQWKATVESRVREMKE